MTGLETAGLAIAGLMALLLLRVPVGLAMLLAGGAGYVALAGWVPLINYLKTAPYWRFAGYELSVVPLFLLMGRLASEAGLSRSLFSACNAWLGHRRGGVALASVGACAAFGAICGSSLATASTMGRVALPEMRRLGYAPAMASGVLAAGGTLGILIPPSIVLVLYAILTEQNLVKMFMAAFLPGLLAALGYLLAVAVTVRVLPHWGPAAPRAGRAERLAGLRDTCPVLAIFLLVIGGIYAGWFTPTEAAAIGAAATGLLASLRGRLGWAGLARGLLGTAETTAMVFLILLGADVFNVFLALSRLPAEAAVFFAVAEATPYLVLVGMLLLYLVLGCVMDSLSMILLTVPVFFPVVMALDFGLGPEETALWFGILALVVVEVGLITPPVGMNVLIINSLARDIPLAESFRGVLPFLLSDGLRVALLIAFPGISLWLVRVLN